MKKEIYVMALPRKEFITSYFDTLVPSIGDTIMVNENKMVEVKQRLLSPASDRVVILVSEAK